MNTNVLNRTLAPNRPYTLRRLLPLLLLSLTVAAASAQTVTMRSQPVRITVPNGVASNVIATVTIVTAGTFTTGVDFSVTGVPAGCTGSLSTNNINVAGTHTAILSFSSPSTLAQGTYDVAIAATGEASYRLPIPVSCSYVWSGINFTNATSTNWNSAGNWLGGVPPGPGDDVVFRELGGVSSTTAGTNVVVSANTEIGSLRFASDTNANRAFNLEILSGATLSVTGAKGFSMLRDSKSSGQNIDATFAGAGTLAVDNPAANFATLIDAQVTCNLDLRNLDNLYINVNRIPLGDYRAYPNWATNGWVGGGTGNEIARFIPSVWLARTNVIKAAHVDANNYNDLGVRDYALTIGNYHFQGTTSNLRFSLGYSNAFFLDSICFSQAIQGGGGHNYNFLNPGSYALFRGIGGLSSRMSVFAIGDAGGPDVSGNSNTRGQVNLSNGTVDALIDRLFVAVDRNNNTNQQTIQGSLTLTLGTFDVNNAYLGYQYRLCGPRGYRNVELERRSQSKPRPPPRLYYSLCDRRNDQSGARFWQSVHQPERNLHGQQHRNRWCDQAIYQQRHHRQQR
jgi:hypothetical protein